LHTRRIPGPVRLSGLSEVFARLESPSILGGNAAGALTGRYSYWAAEPKEIVTFKAGRFNPFEKLNKTLSKHRLRRDCENILPNGIFCGGWTGYFSNEPNRSGFNTGSIGFIGIDSNACLNIAIRTIIIKGERAFVQAGDGIVADSDPQAEWQETITKARALIAGIQSVMRTM
jgi:hypothetical protein